MCSRYSVNVCRYMDVIVAICGRFILPSLYRPTVSTNSNPTFIIIIIIIIIITTTTTVITGPPNGPVLFCSLASVVVVCNAAGERAGGPAAGRVGGRPPPGWSRERSGGQHCTAGQYSYVPLGRHLVIIIVIKATKLC